MAGGSTKWIYCLDIIHCFLFYTNSLHQGLLIEKRKMHTYMYLFISRKIRYDIVVPLSISWILQIIMQSHMPPFKQPWKVITLQLVSGHVLSLIIQPQPVDLVAYQYWQTNYLKRTMSQQMKHKLTKLHFQRLPWNNHNVRYCTMLSILKRKEKKKLPRRPSLWDTHSPRYSSKKSHLWKTL